MVVTTVLQVKHQGREILFEISLEHLKRHPIHARSTPVTLDLTKGQAHSSHINTTREGMDFTTFLRHHTILVARTICETGWGIDAGLPYRRASLQYTGRVVGASPTDSLTVSAARVTYLDCRVSSSSPPTILSTTASGSAFDR